ncbi:FAD-dependent monooxygenase [Streptomyces buecherae]|uniref:FAD-dependent monooxygenase n=1 Tax=Streptomyces buecherae TaxID=2763006 RepID=A0A7H8NGS7_9ACTN|nr:FAD-dependent monooxygenase [Streptomyces buecherae]QKW53630.1 FAD-dependent monooxygenase [Streptomyces buecherae]
MRIAVIGAGPAGLAFAAAAKRLRPHWNITVWERAARADVSGLGVLFSAAALESVQRDTPDLYASLIAEAVRWEHIDIHYRSQTITCPYTPFVAISRTRLLRILRNRCAAMAVDLRYGAPAPALEELTATHDLVAACDGARSATRQTHAETFVPHLDERHCHYLWFGTEKTFDALTFVITERDFGTVQTHAYPHGPTASTCIIELSPETWRHAGLTAPTEDTDGTRAHADNLRWCQDILADHLDGHPLRPQHSHWTRFTTVRNQSWRHRNVVLLGDAAHTTHFSTGSGTRLALEDAYTLANCLHHHPGVPDALAAYEAQRRPLITAAQRIAQDSLEWFEQITHYTGQEPSQFATSLLNRAQFDRPTTNRAAG